MNAPSYPLSPWVIERLLAERRFVTRVGLPESWRVYYERGIDTPGIRHPRRHRLKLAA